MKQNKQTQQTDADTDTDIVMTQDVAVNMYLKQDLWISIFIVSVFANLVGVAIWIALQATSAYDAQLVGFLFNR